MRAIWTLARRNLGRRRVQSLLVGVVIALSVLLFFSGLGMLRELSAPFDRMLETQRGSQLTLRFDSRIHSPEAVAAWFARRPEVLSVTPPMAYRALDGSAYHQGRELASPLFLSERPASGLEQDDLLAVRGGAIGTPAHGEVWIPTSVAAEAGIEPGDVIEVPAAAGLAPLRVAAVVVDPQHSAPFNNPKRLWVGAGRLPHLFELADLGGVVVGVRLADEAAFEALWKDFASHLGGAYRGEMLTPAALRVGYMAPYELMATMLIAFSLLSIVLSLLALHGAITGAILADFRLLGVLRAQGFRPADVRAVYRLQYLLVALVAVPLGLLAGGVLVRRAVALAMRPTGAAIEGGSLLLLGLATAALFLLLVWLFVGRVARRAARLRPADAIRHGAAAARRRGEGRVSRLPAPRRFGVPLLLAVKDLALERRRAALLTVSVLLATLAASLAVDLDHSLRQGLRDPSLLGFDRADVRVMRGGRRAGLRHEVLLGLLARRPEVASVATDDRIPGDLLLADGSSQGLPGSVIAGDMEALGYRTLDGDNPRGGGEVAVGIATARRHGLEAGDSLALFVAGRRLDLEISGIYQSLDNGGTGFRLPLAALRRADPLYEPSRYGVLLAPGIDRETFIAELEGEYGEALDAQPGDYLLRRVLSGVLSGMRLSNGFLAAVFLLAAAMLIVHATLTGIEQRRRVFGILKAVGMTPAEMRASVVLGVGLVAALGIALGLIAWRLGAPLALSLLFSGLGLAAFPLAHSLAGTLALIPLILGFCLLSAWLPSARLAELDPRSLVVE